MKQLHTYYKLGVVALLIALLSGLLPARPSFAQSARLSASLNINQPVDVPPEAVRAEFWVANAMNRVDGPQRAEMVAFELVLMQLYKQNPDLPTAAAVQKVRDLQTAYHSAIQASPSRYPKAGNEGVLSIFAVLVGLPPSSSLPVGAIVAAAHEVYALTLRESMTGDLIGAERILGASETYLSPRPSETAQQTLLHELLDFAQHNQLFGQAFDTLWATELHVGIYATTNAVIASSPSLQSLTGTIHLIDQNTGAIHTTVGNVQSLLDLEFVHINTVLTDGLILLKDISDHQKPNLVDAAHDEAQKAADKDKAEKADKKATEELDKAKENVELIAKFAKYVNNDWGEKIETLGKAGIEIADAISKFAKQVADVGALQALTSISTLALTGNVIGAVTSIISMFSSDGSKPKPDQQILDQIAKLRDQVKALSNNMNSRFDRVDRALNQIYATLINRFDLLDLQLGIIRGDVQEVQTTLSNMQKQLDRMEQHIFVLLSDGFQHDLLLQMNGSIGYKERTGEDMTYATYSASPNGPENTFQSWATLFSDDTLAVGPPTSPPYDDLDVYAQLTLPIPGSNQLVRPLDTNINFFSQYIHYRWGLPSLSSTTIVNPRIWSLSARAYTELGLDWPAHAWRTSQSRATQIYQKGQELQAALRKISTIDTPSGPVANHALFDQLIANYMTKTAELDQAVLPIENIYITNLRVRANPVRIGLIDPWGGANQPIDQRNFFDSTPDTPFPVSFPKAPLCGHTEDVKELPSNFARTMLSAPFQVAYYLYEPMMLEILAAVQPCYDAHWVNIHDGVVGWPEPHDVTYGSLQVDLIANYTAGGTSQAFRTRSVILPEQIIDNDGPDGRVPPLDPQKVAKANWDTGQNIKARFQAGSQITADNPIPAVLDKVESALRAHQQNIYQAVIDELAGVGLLAQAAKRLTGAKALIDVAIGLGLPRALEADEYLRSFLYGSQALPDEAADKRLTGLWLAAKVAPPARNVRLSIIGLMGTRAGALKDALGGYLSQIDAHRYVESHRMIDTTLDRLKLANAMIRTPFLSLSAGSLSFGYQIVGAPSATRTITLTNSGLAAPINLGTIDMVGANAGDFAPTSTCGASLAAGARCTVTLTFLPTAPGDRAAELRIGDDAPNAPHSVSLAGTAWLGARFNAPASVPEGSTINLSLTNPANPANPSQWGPDFSFAFDCGAGYGAFGTSSTAACSTTDNGARAVKGKIRDKDGGVNEYSASVTVTNVAPTASFGAQTTVVEGSAINLTLTNPSDPSSADMASGFQYAFDCGGGYSAFNTGNTAACSTTDNGARAVKGKIRDKDGGVNEYSASVAVTNIAPTATFQAPSSALTGHAMSLALINPVDAPGDMPSLQYAFDCGDGAGYSAFGANSSTSCATNAAGTRQVKGKIRDKDGAISEYSASVTIADALSLTIVSPQEDQVIDVGTPVGLAATFTDVNRRTAHTCTINWGDGTAAEKGSVTEALGSGTCQANHLYSAPGTYIIKLVVENTYGDSGVDAVTFVYGLPSW